MNQQSNGYHQQRSFGGIPFVDLKAQYTTIADEINSAMANVLTRTDFILGEDVAVFEAEFADYCEVTHGIGVDSGLSALELLLRAYGIGPGDEVITAANTFIATALAISSVGAVPVLVDIDPQTSMLDVARIEAAITNRTKAIMPVHLYGHVADMDPIMEIGNRHNLVVIEDASQAHGGRYKGRRVGSLGDAAAFSLYPAKNLGAYGDAGVVVTNDRQIADRVRLLGNYGSKQKYHHEIEGHNHRLDTLHAAVLRVKLRHLDQWNAARRRHAQRYNELLTGSAVQTPFAADYDEPVYHLYVIRTEQRDALQAHLREREIATVIHYPVPIHLQPAYQYLGYGSGDFPVTEQYSSELLSLPIYPELPEEFLVHVADTVRSFTGQPAQHVAALRAAD